MLLLLLFCELDFGCFMCVLFRCLTLNEVGWFCRLVWFCVVSFGMIRLCFGLDLFIDVSCLWVLCLFVVCYVVICVWVDCLVMIICCLCSWRVALWWVLLLVWVFCLYVVAFDCCELFVSLGFGFGFILWVSDLFTCVMCAWVFAAFVMA